jgi:uncharacterized OsmC-like protein
MKELIIQPKVSGFGSSINGGELLLLSLATCFCNDIYREAAKLNIVVSAVEVGCSGNFGAEGEAGYNFEYVVEVKSDAEPVAIKALIQHTDRIAEIHNTLRSGVNVTLIEKAKD